MVAFSGYAGAVVWGVLIYISSSYKREVVNLVLVILLGSLGVVGIFWARDIITLLIMVTIGAVLYVAIRFSWRYLLGFLGIYVLISALSTPLSLVDGRDVGDGATLARITHVPEFIWVMVWWGIALGALWYLFKRSRSMT